MSANLTTLKILALLWAASLAIASGAAKAAPFTVDVGSDYSVNPASITFESSTFILSSTGDIFAPTAVMTAGGAAVSAFGGFLFFPITPSTDFPDRGSGIITYGPDTQFASFADKTTIPYSTGNNYLGLRASQNGQNYYGYAFFTDTVLNSFAFETIANTAISINTSVAAVPEPATWAMMILGMGAIGLVMRRRKVTTRVAYAI